MSFDPNDTNNTIHPGNYEEFFLLYMDNELNEEQMKMVDSFLLAHPDLQGEFDVLMNTRLPLEELSFDKKILFANNMKLSSVDEELLLYIDNELPFEQKNIVELELAANKDYRLQHLALLQTRLDPSEKILYPNKEELYRRTEKVVYFKPWMRVAAAVLIVVIAGMFYLRNSSSTTVGGQNPHTTAGNIPVKQNDPEKEDPGKAQTIIENHSTSRQLANTNSSSHNKKKPDQPIERKKEIIENEYPVEATAFNKIPQRTTFIDEGAERGNELPQNFVTGALGKDLINTKNVTSITSVRTAYTPEGREEFTGENNHKGSVRGFLRKATRMIEKRTGINPTDEDGKLLVGSVAINLK